MAVQISVGQTTIQDLQLIPYPTLALVGIGLADPLPGGNANQALEPGESGLRLTLGLQNTGAAASGGISSRISSQTPGVSLDNSQSSYADIQPGQVVSNTVPYLFSLDPALPCGAALQFQQVVTDANQTYAHDLVFDASITQPPVALLIWKGWPVCCRLKP